MNLKYLPNQGFIINSVKIEWNLERDSVRNLLGNKHKSDDWDLISPIMMQKLYRHSDLKTTINYQANFVLKDADDALDAVLNS
jgi:hypothetical protein